MSNYKPHDLARYRTERRRDNIRSEFERDRARILYSQALRRLGDKTQVLGAGSDDYVRTRLTHSLEVAQVGRQLALLLELDPNLVEAACLAHDIGHPPFGHNGEDALNTITKDIGGFEGNAQTFRLLTYLEPKSFLLSGRSIGLNLTRATLNACVKYPWDRQKALVNKSSNNNSIYNTVKFNVYTEDLTYFNWVRKSAPPLQKSLEAQIMDLSDDISYCVHDFEDAVALGKLNPVDLLKSFHQEKVLAIAVNQTNVLSSDDYEQAWKYLVDNRYFDIDFVGSLANLADLKNLTSSLIGHFVGTVANYAEVNYAEKFYRYSTNLEIPKDILAQIQILKAISIYYVMDSRDMAGVSLKQKRIIHNLVEKYMQFSPKPSPLLERLFLDMWQDAQSEGARLRVAVDQVASLTDTRAKQLSNTIF